MLCKNIVLNPTLEDKFRAKTLAIYLEKRKGQKIFKNMWDQKTRKNIMKFTKIVKEKEEKNNFSLRNLI